MKGSYHFKRDRYFVNIYWDGKPNRIWRYNGEPIWHEKTAAKLLNKIRAEVDDGTFNLKSYMPDSPLSLSTFSEIWLKASTAGEATKKFYRKAVKKCIEHFGKDFDIRTFTHSKLQIFYNELVLSTKGKYNVLSSLKTMLHFAMNDELISRLPPFPSLPIGLPEEIPYLTIEQQGSMLQAIPDRHRPIFELAMEYGLRIEEVLAIQKDCLRVGELVIKRSFSDGVLVETTKTKRVRVYGLTKNAQRIIASIKPSLSPFLFTRDNGKHYTWKVMTKAWKRACATTGIDIKLNNGLRHSLGCQLLDQGVDLEAVRDVYGHTSTEMTRRYAKRSQRRITNILEYRTKVAQCLPNENQKAASNDSD